MLSLVAAALAAEYAPSLDGCDGSNPVLLRAYNDTVAAWNRQDFKAARVAVDRVLRKHPDCQGLWYFAAAARVLTVDPEAYAYVVEGASRWPQDPNFAVWASELLFVAQDFDGALASAQRAMVLAPDSGHAHDVAIKAFLRLGRYDEAMAIAGSFPGAEEGGRDCRKIEVLVDRGEVTAAEALRESCASSTDPVREQALARLGGVGGDLRASAEFAAGIGASSSALYTLAMEHLRRNEYAPARDLLERALKIEPWNAFTRIQLAMVYLNLGQDKRAREHLEQLYATETWVTRWESGATSGVLTKGQEQTLDAALQVAFGQLVLLLVEQGDPQAAATAQRKAEARYGRIASLAASGVATVRAVEGPAAGWAATERALASFPDDAALLSLAGRLAFADPAGVPAGVLAAIVARGAPPDHFNLVAGLSNEARFDRCAELGRETYLPSSTAEFAELVYQCATRAGDLDLAGRVLADRGAALPADIRLFHGFALLEAGKPTEALALASSLESGTVDRAELEVEVFREQDRLDDALRVLGTLPIRPSVRYNLAVDLFNARRDADAKQVLAVLDCKELGEGAKVCRELGDAIREASAP